MLDEKLQVNEIFKQRVHKTVRELIFLTDHMWLVEADEYAGPRLEVARSSELTSLSLEESDHPPVGHVISRSEFLLQRSPSTAVFPSDGGSSAWDTSSPVWRCVEGSLLTGGRRRVVKQRSGLHSVDVALISSSTGRRTQGLLEGIPVIHEPCASTEADDQEGSVFEDDSPTGSGASANYGGPVASPLPSTLLCPELSASTCMTSSSESVSEVIVGPTEKAARPLSFEDLFLLSGDGNDLFDDARHHITIRSRSHELFYSDIVSLTRQRGQRLSFGSVLHACGHTDLCRPCMFERKSRHCRKSWLCDFCHLHIERPTRTRRGGKRVQEKERMPGFAGDVANRIAPGIEGQSLPVRHAEPQQ
mmetsp:Transcript_28505/g.60484  ORF Transcript_28505/g.60484 Transcript_28505/m.60484 type:complete len:361 (+) Transcript_28505:197-1279(+)